MNGPGWSSVILITVVVSTGVSLTTQWAGDTGRLDVLWQGKPSEIEAPAPGDDVDNFDAPQLIGLPARIAGELLEARGLRMERTGEHPDNDLPSGAVLSQQPLPGTSVAPNTLVQIVVSTGPEAKAVVLGNLSGMTLEAAKAVLKEAGLKAGDVSGAAEGVVASTTPPAGETLSEGDSVSMVLAISAVEVPKVTGLNMRKAKAALEAVGLKLGRVRSRFVEAKPAWAVLTQKPAAGEKAAPGSAVDLVRNEE